MSKRWLIRRNFNFFKKSLDKGKEKRYNMRVAYEAATAQEVR